MRIRRQMAGKERSRAEEAGVREKEYDDRQGARMRVEAGTSRRSHGGIYNIDGGTGGAPQSFQPCFRRSVAHSAPLHPLHIIETPFSRVGLDIVGPLTPSVKGRQYLLVLVDYATRYP
ncbi:hypothetical protein NDU88_005797 [Pleurodeles waltl]|uniref:Uncharacterized protein n=1 Tax=Pleurodeles waltl TaxID=8319 RepID=A0AAV7VK16_PLEWA|nr:hypothetical protein NDU88_005797 [Pleurodeles waltl]